MKLSIHKKISSLSTMLATGIVTLSALTSQAEAGVSWTFAQNGADVTATVGGSFSIDVGTGTNGSASDLAFVGFTSFYSIAGPDFVQMTSVGVSSQVLAVGTTPSSGTGNFGHSGGILYWDDALGTTVNAGTDFAGGGTAPSLTWNNTTVDTIFGGGFFDNGPVTAWTLTGGAATDTISYAAAVPEPSSSALLVGLGTLALLARRRR